MAFQGPSLLPPLTVLENVALPVILAGGADGDAIAAARELLDIFEVDAVADKLPEELSGGQSQRAGLARAQPSLSLNLPVGCWPPACSASAVPIDLPLHGFQPA